MCYVYLCVLQVIGGPLDHSAPKSSPRSGRSDDLNYALLLPCIAWRRHAVSPVFGDAYEPVRPSASPLRSPPRVECLPPARVPPSASSAGFHVYRSSPLPLASRGAMHANPVRHAHLWAPYPRAFAPAQRASPILQSFCFFFFFVK